MSVPDDKQRDPDRDRVGHEGHGGEVEFSSNGLCEDAGVVTMASDDGVAAGFADAFLGAVAHHRHFDRELEAVPA